MIKRSSLKYFITSPEIIRLAVMPYVRFPPSPHYVEDLLHEPGIDFSHETVHSLHKFKPMFAAQVLKRWIEGMKLRGR